jgi:hypothetical protein
MPQICDMGQTALLPLRRKACYGFFARKIRRLRPGSNPRSWVPEASMLTNRPLKPLSTPCNPSILTRNDRGIIKMCIDLHVMYLLLLSYFNQTRIVSTDFSKNTRISNLIKIRSVGAELFHADRRTDRQT